MARSRWVCSMTSCRSTRCSGSRHERRRSERALHVDQPHGSQSQRPKCSRAGLRARAPVPRARSWKLCMRVVYSLKGRREWSASTRECAWRMPWRIASSPRMRALTEKEHHRRPRPLIAPDRRHAEAEEALVVMHGIEERLTELRPRCAADRGGRGGHRLSRSAGRAATL